MPAASVLVALLFLVRPVGAEKQATLQAPAYTASSLVNAASQQAGAVAPNTIATLYGSELAFVTRALRAEDIRDGILPTLLSGSGVRVLVNNIPAHIYYVSPRQVNILIPANLVPGPAELQLTLDGRAGPAVPLTLAAAAPAAFQIDERTVLAVHEDGSVVTRESPARPGEVIVLYATGLGKTIPAVRAGEVARGATALDPAQRFQVLVGGNALSGEDLLYVGLTPGFAGLYQVNFRLPREANDDPEIQLRSAGAESPRGLTLPLRKP